MTTLAHEPRTSSFPNTPLPLRAGPSLPPDRFHALRRRLVLDCCKWDPQVGDVSTLAPFPLLISPAEWSHLARAAEQLAAETLQLESALLPRPDLHSTLGLPRPLRPVLSRPTPLTYPDLRVMRFDFHPTTDGWRVSEVNSDVPGGYAESAPFACLFAPHIPHSRLSGDPAAAVADVLAIHAHPDHPTALLSAPGFMEDHQVVSYLSRVLASRGLRPTLASPAQLRFQDGQAHLNTAWYTGPLSVIIRFYQAEWLPRLARRAPWSDLFTTSTPVLNHPRAALTESKRLPLVWDTLNLDLPAWRHYLPETRDPRQAPWRTDDAWLLKTAYCNTGDTVTIRSRTRPRRWRSTCLDVMLRPTHWLAQRRFTPLPLPTPVGPLHPCIGVYTVAGRACGAYARLSPHCVIDYAAIDAALLIDDTHAEPAP